MTIRHLPSNVSSHPIGRPLSRARTAPEYDRPGTASDSWTSWRSRRRFTGRQQARTTDGGHHLVGLAVGSVDGPREPLI